MRRLILLFLLGAVAAAVVMRPGPDEVEEALRGALYQRLLTAEVDQGREILGNAALIACRIDPASCYDLLRAGLNVRYENRWLYARVEVEGFGRQASCWGAFGRFWCPGGFAEVPRT